jgi:hypothetical protein
VCAYSRAEVDLETLSSALRSFTPRNENDKRKKQAEIFFAVRYYCTGRWWWEGHPVKKQLLEVALKGVA